MKILKENSTGDLSQLDPFSCGIYNIKEGSKGDSLIRSSIVPSNFYIGFDEIKALSKSINSIVYQVPEGVTLIFNEEGYLKKVEGNSSPSLWQFIDGWPMPYECFLNGFPFSFHIKRLWEADIPIKEYSVEKFRWMLDLPWWKSEGGDMYSLSPRQVLDDIEKYPSHKESIVTADLSYPLIVTETHQDRLLTLDGAHRLVKSILEDLDTVKVNQFDKETMKKFILEKDTARYERWLGGLIG